MSFIGNVLKSAAVAVALIAAPLTASATTVAPTTNILGVDIEYDFGGLSNDTFDTAAINLQDARFTLLQMVVDGTGSLTITTFVDPFINAGAGAANLLLGLSAPLAANSITVSWGGAPAVDLSDGMQKMISTTFAAAGVANGKDLVFTWSGVSNKQVSSQLAPIPLPAAGVLLLGALGGLALMRRRTAA